MHILIPVTFFRSITLTIYAMLMPKRSKYRKHQKQKGSRKGSQSNTLELRFGRYGIKTTHHGEIHTRTIEAVRRSITRKLKRSGQVWTRIFPDRVVTTKPAEVRMGKGKGSPSHWACRVRPGQVLYEIDGVTATLAMQAVKLAHHKLPVKTCFVRL